MNDLVLTLSSTLPFVAIFCVLSVLIIHVAISLRNRVPAKVNCWFCNSYIKVPYSNRNSFTCTVCSQYNGFNNEGDYNKIIPEQYQEIRNTSKSCRKNKKKSSNGLCKLCNNNQRLKIHQLANFIPLNPMNYDAEIEHFEKHLEKSYKLCHKCDKVLKSTLQTQNRWLFGMKFANLKSKKDAAPKITSEKGQKSYIRMLLLIMTTLLLFKITFQIVHTFDLVSKGVNFLQPFKISLKKNAKLNDLIQNAYNTTTTQTTIANVLQVYNGIIKKAHNLKETTITNMYMKNLIGVFPDMPLIFDLKKSTVFLVALLGLHVTMQLNNKAKQIIPVIAWVVLIILDQFHITDIYIQLVQLAGILLIIHSLLNASGEQERRNIVLKRKISIEPKSNNSSNEYFNSFNESSLSSSGFSFFDDSKSCKSSVSYCKPNSICNMKTNHVFGSSLFRKSTSPTSFSEISQVSAPFRTKTKLSCNDAQSDTASLFDRSYCMNNTTLDSDLQNSFLKLNLGYNATKCYEPRKDFICFTENKNVCRPRPVLSPAKLNLKYNFANVYPDSTLSRSSSQSSGFISQTTNPETKFDSLPSSPANSLHGDLDNISLFSDTLRDKNCGKKYMCDYFNSMQKSSEPVRNNLTYFSGCNSSFIGYHSNFI